MKIIKNLFLISILSFVTVVSKAQKEDNVWYFGKDGAGLDFSNCEPVVVNMPTPSHGSSYVFWEGAASICERKTGKLLFFTDGIFFHNRNFGSMDTTITGLWNTVTQNIIVPEPGNDSIYYFIQPEVQASYPIYNWMHPGMNYAVIDMNLNGGLGEVTSRFNHLIDSSCEKLTAVRSPDEKIVWLIGHQYGSNRFFVFKIDSNGINTTPAFYNIGPVIYTYEQNTAGRSAFDAIGEMKASPNGRKLAFTTFYNATTALFDFDNSTGAITNPIIININEGQGSFGGYGVSFSPDNTKLYFSGEDTAYIAAPYFPYNKNGKVYQFDISSDDSLAIANSKTMLYNCSTCGFGSIKLAPNGKIYLTHYGEQDSVGIGDYYLDVINEPDNAGLACGYVHDNLYLNGSRSSWGLDNSIEQNFTCQPVDGINAVAEIKDVLVYPNPVADLLHVSLPGNTSSVLRIYNLLGDRLLNRVQHEKNISIEISTFPNGIYFLQVKSENGLQTQKFVVQH